jgi:glycosyltransferase involved in cell wall biosynthesis
MLEVLLITLFLTLIFQFLYYLSFLSLKVKNNYTETKELLPVSIIVCCKNEQNNIQLLIPKILEQNYPEFEIILVNDNSTDDTFEVLQKFEKKHQSVKVVNVNHSEAFWGNKKFALTLGIKAAKYNNLLFTDADCIPSSKNWIKEMTSRFSSKTDIILGYSGYTYKEKSLLNKLIRYETLLTAAQYLSFAKLGAPYMGVGRNLAYKKELFFEVNGFASHIQLKSGDDDLFVNQNGNKKNTAIVFSKESFTTSIPKFNYKDWIYQKRRHVTTSKHYRNFHKCILATFYLSQVFSYFLLLALMFTIPFKIILSIYIVRLIIISLILNTVSRKLEEQKLIPYLAIIEPLLVLIQLYIFFRNLISKPKYWS